MKSRAFLLGFFAIGGQVLLLRELVSSLNGDELFISTALFGWLVSVALGAYLGGKPYLQADPTRLLAVGAVLLVIIVPLTRFIPTIIGQLPGEVVPFSISVLISILVMFPVGFISGWLFPRIAAIETKARAGIIQAYLLEGVGAFVGGLALVFVVGGLLSALETAVAVAAIVFLFGLAIGSPRWLVRIPLIVALAALLAFVVPHVSWLELKLEQFRYDPFEVKQTFDTPYGRQTLLSREGELVLLTDNTVEGVFPELATAEDLVVAPLVYHPDAETVLYVGRAEFTVGLLGDSLSHLTFYSLDPRRQLSGALDDIILKPINLERLNADLFAYVSGAKARKMAFDIAVINPGSSDSYKNSRYFTPYAMGQIKSVMKPGGVVMIPTEYDTDRFIGTEEKQLLSTIYNVIEGSFEYVSMWPGSRTLFFASDSSLFDIPYDTIVARLDSSVYQAQFVSSSYLPDRFEELKKGRLNEAVYAYKTVNTVERPLLPHLQALFRSKTNVIDQTVISEIVGQPYWTLAIPGIFVLFFIIVVVTPSARGRFALFLYFVAGFVSLSLELVSFYVYQSLAGSLYSELAVLIGAFMLGLALGTYFASQARKGEVAHIGLFILFVLTIGFELSYMRIPLDWALYYHTAFMLISAAATGILFVGATRQFYGEQSRENRGLGYAYEIAGSSLGALVSVTVLLPVIGLTWLLLGIAGLIALAYFGLLLSR